MEALKLRDALTRAFRRAVSKYAQELPLVGVPWVEVSELMGG